MGIQSAWRELWKSNPSVIQKKSSVIRRSYAGANINRLTSNWVTNATSVDSELKGSLKKLRNRSRQLIRDVDYARNAIRCIVDNTTGTGVRLQLQVRKQRGGKLDQKINQQIEYAWHQWGRKDSCHTAGKLSWDDITRTAVSSMVEGGECLIRIVRGEKFGRSNIPFALEVLESDMLDEDYDGKSSKKGWEWRMGVEVDKWGRPQNYAFFTRHPGDTSFTTLPANKKRHIIVSAKDVIHLYKVERPGQTRGVPWLASAIERLHHLQGYEQAELVRARASSALMAWIQSPEGELSGDDVEDEERVYDMSPGSIRYLAKGESVHVPNLDAPDGQFEPFIRAMLRALASGVGCSYEAISRDYSQTNYSSSRLSLLQDQQAFKAIQAQLKDNLLQIIFDEWLEVAVLGGTVDLPNYQFDPDRYRQVRWLFPGWQWVDPIKEVQSAQMAVRSGFKTQAQVVAEMGGDLEELLTARKNEIEMAEQLGLKFDTEPDSTKVEDKSNSPNSEDGT
jgi:lambda family phage portal protein